MSHYKDQFDSHLAEAVSAASNVITDFDFLVPGLRPSAVKRLLNNISKLLGRIDKDGCPYPEYLIDESGSIPDQVIKEVAKFKNAVSSGAESFLEGPVANLAYHEWYLERALGTRPKLIREIKSQQIRELQSILLDSQASLSHIHDLRKRIEAEESQLARAIEGINAGSKRASEDSSYISKTREAVEKLASGDARNKDSLERLIRTAREKFTTIEAAEASARSSNDKIARMDSELQSVLREAKETLSKLQSTQAEADAILKGATQAGLAGAYKTERDRLASEQKWYAGFFYGGVAVILVYAVVFLLPIFSGLIQNAGDGTTKIKESALLLLVRLFVLAPVVWALMFTNRRYSKVETLQMDYAAKAATALAYSGYKDEMANDRELAKKLKDGLLVRFLEHPERLLNKHITESIGLSSNGNFTYASSNIPTAQGGQVGTNGSAPTMPA